MKIARLIAVVSAVLGMAAVAAQAQTQLLNVTFTGTKYGVGGGKILKQPQRNANLVSDCTDIAGSQLVVQFDDSANPPQLLELDVVNPCGGILCQVATLTTDLDTVQDTGAVVNGKREIVSFVTIQSDSGTQGGVLCDLKLTYSAGEIKGGSIKCTGLLTDNSGNPVSISLTISKSFKPASNCPQ